MNRLRSLEETKRRLAQQAEPKSAGTAPPPPVGGGGTFQFRFKSMQTDYIICRTYDGLTEGADDVAVALPYLLRRTPFHGQTRAGYSYTYASGNIQRTSTGGTPSTTVTQRITPTYEVNDIIYASPCKDLALFVGAGEDAVPIVWIDDNRDARTWYREEV